MLFINIKNKLYLKPSGRDKFYSIISIYDDKWLNYGDSGLYMQECTRK